MNATETINNLKSIWLVWQIKTQEKREDTQPCSDYTTHTMAVSKLWPEINTLPRLCHSPLVTKLNFKGCIYPGAVYILLKQLNMEPQLGSEMSGCAAKFVPL